MDRITQQSLLLMLLLVFYCAFPVIIFVICLYELVSTASDTVESQALIKFVSGLASDPSKYLSIIHQMIMPVVAAVTAVSFRDFRLGGLLSWVFIVPLATIFICIADGLIFTTLSQLQESQHGVVAQLFIGMASNLAVYVMLLVGLQLNPKAGG